MTDSRHYLNFSDLVARNETAARQLVKNEWLEIAYSHPWNHEFIDENEISDLVDSMELSRIEKKLIAIFGEEEASFMVIDEANFPS